MIMTEEKKDYIPNLDELALRLQVEAQEEPYEGIVLMGKSGRAYSLVNILAHHMQFMAEALTFSVELFAQMQEEGEKIANKKPRQPKKTDNTAGNTTLD